MAFEGIGAFGSKATGFAKNLDFTTIAIYVFFSLVIIGGFAALFWYIHKMNQVKYKVIVKYDTQNGIRYRHDTISEKTQSNGNKYLWLNKLKVLVPEVDPKRTFYGKGGGLINKPLIELYLDKEKNAHQTDFTAQRPMFNAKGEVTGHTPLVTPYQTKEGQAVYHEYVKGVFDRYKPMDNFLRYAPAFILMASVLGMVMIIVATKVA